MQAGKTTLKDGATTVEDGVTAVGEEDGGQKTLGGETIVEESIELTIEIRTPPTTTPAPTSQSHHKMPQPIHAMPTHNHPETAEPETTYGLRAHPQQAIWKPTSNK